MSSFETASFFYLFKMKSGAKKLAYGSSSEEALEILRMRLNETEMAEILPDQFEKISQRELQKHIDDLG